MRKRHAGAALVISLLLLMVGTVLGVAGASGALTGERIAGNHRQASEAFMVAEAGVSRAVAWWQAATEHYDDEGGYWILSTDDPSTAALKAAAMAAAIAADGHTLRDGVSWRIEDLAHAGPHTIRFTSVGTVAGTGAMRRITALYERPHTRFPEAPAAEAAYTCFGRDCLVNVDGDTFVDGHDWDVPAGFDCGGSGCGGSRLDPLAHPAVAGVLLPDGGTIATTGGSHGHGTAEHGLTGDPATRITAAYDGEYGIAYWSDYVAQWGDAATASGVIGAGELGTRTEPRVTEIAASAHLHGNVDGAGVLIVRENARLEVSGTFHFEGLIVVEAGATIGMDGGNVDVFGAIVALGGHPAAIDADFAGNVSIKYSRTALANVTAIATGTAPGGASAWQER